MGVVHLIALSCGKKYVGHMGRCLNECLKEHHYRVNTAVQGHLGIHCRNCDCKLEFKKCTVVAKHHQELTRDISEANLMHQLRDVCVSMPSVALTKNHISGSNAIGRVIVVRCAFVIMSMYF